MQLVHLAGLFTEQVEQGSWQLGLQLWADVKKYPLTQAEQPVAEHF